MTLIGSRRRWIVIILIISIAGLAFLFAQTQTTPFHVGSAVDEIWDYIHTEAGAGEFSVTILPIHKRTDWVADLTTIKSETSFTCHKTSFAIRRTVYSYNNGFVTGVHSKWEIQWPF